jgi:hypothetical protein
MDRLPTYLTYTRRYARSEADLDLAARRLLRRGHRPAGTRAQ